MRALQFMKIDYIRTKQQVVFVPILLLIVSAVMMINYSDESSLNVGTIFCYMVFMTVVFSTTPFGLCQTKDAGFLLLLPASAWSRVAGRFLYGVSMMATAVVLGLLGALGYRALGYGANPMDLPFCLIGFAAGMLCMTAEYVFFYLCGENKGQNLLGLVRVLPGMCFFFASANLAKTLMAEPEKTVALMQTVGSHLIAIGWIGVAVSVAALMAAVALCVKVTEKRDAV